MKLLNRLNNNIIFEVECETVKDLVLTAVKSGANLEGANLGGAYLEGAYLEGANLEGAKGILKYGIKPLQILGSKHFLVVQEIGKIKIGCEHHTVEHWLDHYKETGTKAEYTDQQIEEYFEHIKYAEQWMIKNGVRFLEVENDVCNVRKTYSVRISSKTLP